MESSCEVQIFRCIREINYCCKVGYRFPFSLKGVQGRLLCSCPRTNGKIVSGVNREKRENASTLSGHCAWPVSQNMCSRMRLCSQNSRDSERGSAYARTRQSCKHEDCLSRTSTPARSFSQLENFLFSLASFIKFNHSFREVQ